MSTIRAIGTVGTIPARGTRTGGWQHWAPYAAVAWSLLYAALGIYWAVSGSFPYDTQAAAEPLGSLLARFGPVIAWIVVVAAGLPAAALGVVMLRGVRALRPLWIALGSALAAILLLGIADLMLLETLGYVPFTLFRFITGGDTAFFVKMLDALKWTLTHQLFCIVGGFIWLAATVSYARRSSDACLYCGRRDGPQGWTSPESAARWGRIAVYVAMAVPILYAFTRYAWALGWPLGMTKEYWLDGQARGMWIAGLFLANFGLVGALLMLGLVQKWGERFPRWMLGLAGRNVPIGLAVVPAALVSVVVFVGGLAIWGSLSAMSANLASSGAAGSDVVWGVIVQVGPTLLFPVWGIALALGALAYYFRRRGPCDVCRRG